MAIADSGLYAAFRAKDARFDGRFFVGISSTGIYCRPVCRAKPAKIENCTFYGTAAEAEQAGFRPCLLCRPELAPGVHSDDASAGLAHRAARLLEENCQSGLGIGELAARLGCTDRHLRRAFAAQYRVSPVQYLQTCRLLLAKNLLTDARLSVLDVAMAAGFGSLRRFNDLFKSRYRLSPTALRKQVPEDAGRGDVAVSLGYRPPYRWAELLRFLGARAIAGVEIVEDGTYARTVRMVAPDGRPVQGWVRVGNAPERNALTVSMSEALLPVLPQVLARIRHQFDLSCDPLAIDGVLSSMDELRPGLHVPGTRLPGCFDAFEMAVRAILGQQITVKAAGTLAARVTQAHGMAIETGIEGLDRAFPTPVDILSLDGPIENHLGPLGITSARANTIRLLAVAFAQGDIDFGPCAQPEREMEKQLAMRGIGRWTAQYIAMRAMGWPDAFLETDVGIRNALPGYTPSQLAQLAEAWRPWRSYATINLWNSL